MNKDELNEKLQKAIQFSRSDLSMNKQGILTPAQIQLLKNTDSFNGSKMAKLILGITIGGFVLMIGREGTKILSLQIILPFLGLSAIMYFGISFYNKNNLRKLEEGKILVEKIQGKVNSFHDEKIANASVGGQYSGVVKTATNFAGINYGDYAYVLELNGKKINTNKAISEAFEKDKEYMIYFVRTSKTEYQNTLHGAIVVSAEAI